MISAMALMPMPPMPRMCTGPMFKGICMRRSSFVGRAWPNCRRMLRASLPPAYQLLDEIGKAADSVGPARGLGGGCGLHQCLGRRQQPGDGLAKELGRQLLLFHAPGAPRFGKPARVL